MNNDRYRLTKVENWEMKKRPEDGFSSKNTDKLIKGGRDSAAVPNMRSEFTLMRY